jgi:hypothetical protein
VKRYVDEKSANLATAASSSVRPLLSRRLFANLPPLPRIVLISKSFPRSTRPSLQTRRQPPLTRPSLQPAPPAAGVAPQGDCSRRTGDACADIARCQRPRQRQTWHCGDCARLHRPHLGERTVRANRTGGAAMTVVLTYAGEVGAIYVGLHIAAWCVDLAIRR